MDYLNELNKEQYHAVTTKSKKVLVIAGAGSGKTKVLTDRIKYLIDNGARRNEILAFTFTKKAAKEMKDRLIDYRFENVFTFHSYCFQQLTSNPREYGLSESLYVVDDNYKQILVSNILEAMNLRIDSKIILRYLGKRKNGIDVCFNSSKDENLFNTIYYKYQEYLMNCGAIDFDDMIPLFINNFNNISDKEFILRNAKYILVDECQDTNQLQYDLVNLLSSRYGNIFMVGDDKQLIYSFRSSDIKIMNHFRLHADEVIALKQNYRSALNILDSANKLISHNNFEYENDIYSLIPKKYDVKKISFQSTSEEASAVAYTIERLLKIGYEPKDIAVLYRNNYQSNQLELAMINRNIPYVVYGKLPFNEQAECKNIISAYRFMRNLNDSLLFYMLLPLDSNEIKAFKTGFNKDSKTILDYALNCNNEKIRKIALGLRDIIDNRKQYSKSELFANLTEVLFDNGLKTKQADHIKLLKDIIISSELNDECEILNEIMIDGEIDDKSKGVRLLTIHKAKGLEFKCVFLISLNDGILPAITKTNDQLEEERRLCYVAITRAKEFLQISSANYHFINGIRKRLRPSVFMSEIIEASSENVSHMI
ncbi:MAG: ATP-dependent helicase [Bacilli bacterium]|nr:ATP-dependent helicase [Bacilli bacterium]